MSAFAGEVLPAGQWTPQEAATHVVEAYAKSVLAVIETGRRLLEAKERLPHGGWLPFVELLPFSARTAQRFMQIAEHPLLGNPTRVTDLPATYGTLAVLAQLPPAEIEARIRAECARQQISGRELARRLGETPMWTQRRLSGAQEMTLDELGRIAAVLGVDPAAMLAVDEGAA